jgi:hypothetical protein
MSAPVSLLPARGPLGVACPTCGAEEGHECTWPDPTKFGRGWALIRSKVPHAARRAKAKEQEFSDEPAQGLG